MLHGRYPVARIEADPGAKLAEMPILAIVESVGPNPGCRKWTNLDYHGLGMLCGVSAKCSTGSITRLWGLQVAFKMLPSPLVPREWRTFNLRMSLWCNVRSPSLRSICFVLA
jgi:hypothetical protein